VLQYLLIINFPSTYGRGVRGEGLHKLISEQNKTENLKIIFIRKYFLMAYYNRMTVAPHPTLSRR
jgi:hypothetical protein